MINELSNYIDKSMTLTPSRKRKLESVEYYMEQGPCTELTIKDKENIQKESKYFNLKIDSFAQTSSESYIDIKSIKKEQKNTISQRTMDFIKSIKGITEQEKEWLLYYANNVEKRLRGYDDPELQKKMIEEELILNACLQNTSYKLSSSVKTFLKEYPGQGEMSFNTEKLPQSFIELYSTLTPTRKAIANIIYLDYGHGKKKIPYDELETLCASFKNPELHTFDQGFKENKKQRKKLAVATLLKYINDEIYSDKKLLNKRLRRYVNLSYAIAENKSLAISFGLEHYQLEECLKDSISTQEFKMFDKELKDSLLEDRKYTSYTNNLSRGTSWWFTTLALKFKTEGIESLFDIGSCDALATTEAKIKRASRNNDGISDSQIKSNIFNNYNEVSKREKFTQINNQIALEKRIIYPAWIKNNKIYSKNGGEVLLSLSDNRLKVTFKNYASGEACVDLMYRNNGFNKNFSDVGLTAIIDGENVSLSNFEKVKEICNGFNKKDISFTNNL